MSTIKAILEPHQDGTLHLPLPPELRHGKLNVTAVIEPAETQVSPERNGNLKGFGCLKGKIWISPDFDQPLDDFADYMK